MKNRYKITTIIVSSIICLIVIYLHLLSHDKTQEIYLQQTEKIIIDLRKDFLKDTVDNVFLEIDSLRESKRKSYKKNMEARLRRINEELNTTDEEFIDFFILKFMEDSNSKMWTAYLWDDLTDEILYSTSDLNNKNITIIKNDLKGTLSSYVVIKKNNIEGIFGVSKSYIDGLVKLEIADIIRTRKFSSDSYIWINEVINYDGGKNYALVKVHPNLESLEGTYLSTDIEDINGNLPYLEELEGIKKDGELFFNYYFKKLNTSEISEKISYAKLYKDFNWIIAMGVHLDDIVAYTEKTNSEIYALSSESIIRLLRYIFLVLLIGFILLYLVEKNQLSSSTRLLEKEINEDALTRAYSRKYGESKLSTAFKQYKNKGEEYAIMMFDIDNFKDINDKYGHKIGDNVLLEVVKTINDIIRSSDRFIRWGGDEFVGIFPGLRQDHVIEFGEKVLARISALEISIDDLSISTTISIGFSYFKETDLDYNEVLKRADDAMYESKNQGKNIVNILL